MFIVSHVERLPMKADIIPKNQAEIHDFKRKTAEYLKITIDLKCFSKG